jgi:sulfur-oxidizing protein SoxY
MNATRRTVLKSATASGVLAGLIATGALRPTRVLAAEWNRAAFEAKDANVVLKTIGAGAATESKDLTIRLPEIAENGAVVPVDVASNIPNTTSISIVVVMNPFPLSAQFNFANGALPEVSVRLKLGETSMVKALAMADGKFYTVQKQVKVTVGGCGG